MACCGFPGPASLKATRQSNWIFCWLPLTTRHLQAHLPRRIAERCALLSDARLVEDLLDVENRLLGGFQHRIHAPYDTHRKDDIRVLPTFEEIAQDIVGDAPDEGDNLVVRCLVHY